MKSIIRLLSLFCLFLLLTACFTSNVFNIKNTSSDIPTSISEPVQTFTAKSTAAGNNEYSVSYLGYTPQYDKEADNDKYYYLNETNIKIARDTVTISPVEVYIDSSNPLSDAKAYVNCRLYNGYDYEVSDIYADWIQFGCDGKSIGRMSSAKCEDITLPSHGTTIYEFVFDDCYINDTTDLSRLEFEALSHADVHKPYQLIKQENELRQRLVPDQQCTYDTDDYTQNSNMADICPTKIYYEGDKLIVYCNIYNGYSYGIKNIKLNRVNLYSNGKLIAQGNIGVIYQSEIKSGQSESCKFEFDFDSIVEYNAKIIDPYLSYYYSYSHTDDQ